MQMKLFERNSSARWALRVLMALLPLSSSAQNQEADPAAPTQGAAPHYESAFRNYQAAADSGETPDKAWRAANDQVARLRGHAGHLRNAGPREGASPAAPAVPEPAPTPAPPAGHAGRHGQADN